MFIFETMSKQRENGGTGEYQIVYHLQKCRNKSIHRTQHTTLFFFHKKKDRRKILRKVIPSERESNREEQNKRKKKQSKH